jgi:hypothetical protein
MKISDNHFELIMEATIKLTKMRQDKCEHLLVENLAPEILVNLLKAYNIGSEFGLVKTVKHNE